MPHNPGGMLTADHACFGVSAANLKNLPGHDRFETSESTQTLLPARR